MAETIVSLILMLAAGCVAFAAGWMRGWSGGYIRGQQFGMQEISREAVERGFATRDSDGNFAWKESEVEP